MVSLRTRLLIGLAGLVLAIGTTAGALTFRWAYSEEIEDQDAILVQIAALAMNSRLSSEPPAEGKVDAEARVTIDELGGAVDSPTGNSAIPPLPAGLSNGLQTVRRGPDTWRVIVRTRPDGSRVAISQPTAARDEIARGTALRSVLPLCVLIPCLMGVVVIVINYSLRPISRLTAQLDAKESGHLQQLPTDGIPKELLPFIASINRLLERIGTMFDHQRRFIADAAHELRTPITALALQAENLDHADLPPESRERLAALRSGIRRTGHLLEQLLALARYDEDSHANDKVVALDETVKGVIADLLPMAQSRAIDLGVEQIESVEVRADSGGLRALVRNLVDNSLRYSLGGGAVNIAVRREGSQALFRIEDAGPGIPETDLARIFEPFFRGSRPQGDGSGLGLSIVRRVVASHGGSIRLENIASPQTGLRITVMLPCA
jgi:two-component system OmpR family sensor kinase